MTQQVKGGNQSTTTLKGLRVGTTYTITVRAYQDILGPASNTISVQTQTTGNPISLGLYILLCSHFINQLDTCLIYY